MLSLLTLQRVPLNARALLPSISLARAYATKKESTTPRRPKVKSAFADLPKRPPTAWQFFLQEQTGKLKQVKPDGKHQTVTDIVKEASNTWRSLSEHERRPYFTKQKAAHDEYITKKHEILAKASPEEFALENHKRRKEKRPVLKDPNAPKRPRNGYLLWLQHMQTETNELARVDSVPERGKLAGRLWNELSEADKKKWKDLALKDQASVADFARDNFEDGGDVYDYDRLREELNSQAQSQHEQSLNRREGSHMSTPTPTRVLSKRLSEQAAAVGAEVDFDDGSERSQYVPQRRLSHANSLSKLPAQGESKATLNREMTTQTPANSQPHGMQRRRSYWDHGLAALNAQQRVHFSMNDASRYTPDNINFIYDYAFVEDDEDEEGDDVFNADERPSGFSTPILTSRDEDSLGPSYRRTSSVSSSSWAVPGASASESTTNPQVEHSHLSRHLNSKSMRYRTRSRTVTSSVASEGSLLAGSPLIQQQYPSHEHTSSVPVEVQSTMHPLSPIDRMKKQLPEIPESHEQQPRHTSTRPERPSLHVRSNSFSAANARKYLPHWSLGELYTDHRKPERIPQSEDTEPQPDPATSIIDFGRYWMEKKQKEKEAQSPEDWFRERSASDPWGPQKHLSHPDASQAGGAQANMFESKFDKPLHILADFASGLAQRSDSLDEITTLPSFSALSALNHSDQRLEHLPPNFSNTSVNDSPKHSRARSNSLQNALKKLPKPPRTFLHRSPVLQIISSSTVKDRYLFLFSDLLLIAKPLMDENTIMATNVKGKGVEHISTEHEGRSNSFAAASESLFQIKSVIDIDRVTFYPYRDLSEYERAIEARNTQSGRLVAPQRRMHPVLASALHKFDSSPVGAMNYLVEHGVLSRDPISCAHFLFKTPDLNKRQLTRFLCQEGANEEVLVTFLDCFRFAGMRLDEALRVFTITLQLPSRWPELCHLLDKFAAKWYSANKNVLRFHLDLLHELIHALLRLNALLHHDERLEHDVYVYAKTAEEGSYNSGLARSTHTNATDNQPTAPQENNNTSSSNSAYKVDILCATDFLEAWRRHDQYNLVPQDYVTDMYASIAREKLETGWLDAGMPQAEDGISSTTHRDHDLLISLYPSRLPTRLTLDTPSEEMKISIPKPDSGLKLKLRGQDLICNPHILDFSHSNMQTFTVTGTTLGRTSLMFVKTGPNAHRYVSPSLPRTKTMVIERPFMRHSFQISFTNNEGVRKKYMFGVDSAGKKSVWLDALRGVCEEKIHNLGDPDKKHQLRLGRSPREGEESDPSRDQFATTLSNAAATPNFRDYLLAFGNNATIAKRRASRSQKTIPQLIALRILRDMLAPEESVLQEGLIMPELDDKFNGLNHANDQQAHWKGDGKSGDRQNVRLSHPRQADYSKGLAYSSIDSKNEVARTGQDIVRMVVNNSALPTLLNFLLALKNEIVE